MLKTKAYAAARLAAPLTPFQIERRAPGPRDVLFEILFCGICHSDIHFVNGLFPALKFPAVPGHEVVGQVTRVGSEVSRHKVGDIVGVGCLVDSCRTCAECQAGEEQFCDRFTATYGSLEKDGKTPTYGGYSERITVDERFVLKIGPRLSPAGAAPLLCAGIATYSPLRHWGVKAGSRVGVIGLGGLGHIAVKLAAAMGADVTVLSTSASKANDAARLGARDFAITKDEKTFTRLAGSFDLVLNTVSAAINYDAFLTLLKRDGVLVILGVPDGAVSFNAFGLMMKRKSIASSPIGGLRETQEMLDFCAQHGIVSDVEIVPVNAVNSAYERILKSDVRYRFVIDMASLRS
jgi:alcohol dehydrogenase (NADP+)